MSLAFLAMCCLQSGKFRMLMMKLTWPSKPTLLVISMNSNTGNEDLEETKND